MCRTIKADVYRHVGDSQVIDALATQLQAVSGRSHSRGEGEIRQRQGGGENIGWARDAGEGRLARRYGLVAPARHPARVALVVRQASNQIAGYAHIGTANTTRKTRGAYRGALLTADPGGSGRPDEPVKIVTGYTGRPPTSASRVTRTA